MITVRGVDNTNQLLYNSCGVYDYTDIYADTPAPVSAPKILDAFNIEYSFEVDAVELIILPHITDSLWSVVTKVANYSNSNAISNGNILRFVNTHDGLIGGILINDTDNANHNILEANVSINFTDKINDVTTINSIAEKQSVLNNNIIRNNNLTFVRDCLGVDDLSNIAKNNREANSYSILTYTARVRSLTINGVAPRTNKLIRIIDTKYNIDSDLLIVGVKISSSRFDSGDEMLLQLIDPTIINDQINKGDVADEFINKSS